MHAFAYPYLTVGILLGLQGSARRLFSVPTQGSTQQNELCLVWTHEIFRAREREPRGEVEDPPIEIDTVLKAMSEISYAR